MGLIAHIGQHPVTAMDDFGDGCRFSGQTLMGLPGGLLRRTNRRRLWPQLYEIGTRSVLVVVFTGMFVGAVLAIQAVLQFKAIGMGARMGSVVNLSVVKELGPEIGRASCRERVCVGV